MSDTAVALIYFTRVDGVTYGRTIFSSSHNAAVIVFGYPFYRGTVIRIGNAVLRLQGNTFA